MEKNPPQQLNIFVTGARNTRLFPTEALTVGEKLGDVIAKKRITLLVAEAEGFPLWVTNGALDESGNVLLFSPAAHKDEHTRVYRLPHNHLITSVIYTGFGRVGAELIGVRSADAVIVGCGSFAYMHALTTAIYEEKPIGILEGDWETDEAVKDLLKKSEYKHDAVFFDTDPHRLVEKIENYLRKNSK